MNDISADVSNVTVTTGKTNPLTLADNFSDAEGTIYAKDLDQSEVLFNRKNGVATISFPLQDGRTMLKNGVVIQGLISLNNRWQKTASRKITYCL